MSLHYFYFLSFFCIFQLTFSISPLQIQYKKLKTQLFTYSESENKMPTIACIVVIGSYYFFNKKLKFKPQKIATKKNPKKKSKESNKKNGIGFIFFKKDDSFLPVKEQVRLSFFAEDKETSAHVENTLFDQYTRIKNDSENQTMGSFISTKELIQKTKEALNNNYNRHVISFFSFTIPEEDNILCDASFLLPTTILFVQSKN